MKHDLLKAAVLFAVSVFSANVFADTYNTDSLDAFRSRINAAKPGDTVILKDGIYTVDDPIVVANSGKEKQPIMIRTETVGGVELRGPQGVSFKPGAEYIELSGFRFTHVAGKTHIAVGSRHIRITRCTFACFGKGLYLGINGDDVEIDHNEFRDKNRAGNMISVAGENGRVAQRVWIHHNYFHDFRKSAEPGEDNGLETIRFGLSHLSMSVGDGIVEYNLFERCQGENELISNKSCDNIYRYNTFIDSSGTQLTLRHGNDCQVYGNYFRNTDGLRIFGDRHRIHDNFFEKNTTGINLGNGDGEVADGAKLTCHDRPDDCVIYKNVFIENKNHFFMGGRRNGLGATCPVIEENILLGGDIAARIDGPCLDAVWQNNIVWRVANIGDMPANAFKAIDPGQTSPQGMNLKILTPDDVGPMAETVAADPSTEIDPAQKPGDYELTGALLLEAKHIGLSYDALHRDVFRGIGFDYSEHPNQPGPASHKDGVHLAVVNDETLNKPVLRFDIHTIPVMDGDRGSAGDRQRNELKTATNTTTWAKMQGNWDEWQRLEWKMKIPKGYQPTPSFCHIHQIKAQDGPNNGSPVITVTLRADRDGSNKRVRVEHNSVGGSGRSLGTMVQAPMSDFEDEWVQIVEEMHFQHDGYYSISMTRIRDGKLLLSTSRDDIDMWRRGASFLRSKYGIYRSLAGGNLSRNPVGQSPLLKNESIFMCDFMIFEKNTNPNPSTPH